jgi:acid phosphatase
MREAPLNRREMLASCAAAAALSAVPQAFGAFSAPSLDFLVVGDWGRNGTEHQREVAAQMGRTAASRGPRCVISVGDNFYEDGVQSSADPQWRTSFEEVYKARSLQVPWYVALGNHDYRGVPQAQIDYSEASPRWRMPARYFKVSGRDLGAAHVDLFVIDTSPLVHKYREQVHSVIAANVAGQDVSAQMRWLEAQLAASSAPWKLVIGHHTIYAGGIDHEDTPETKELIVPLLKKYGVQAYIHGHEHNLQHIRRGGVDYVCSGAGSQVWPVRPIEGTLFCIARSGFAAMRSEPHRLTLEFRDFDGKSLHRAEIPNRAAAVEAA